MIRWKKNSGLIVLFLLPFFADAQQYGYKCNLDSFPQSGFYAIGLTPDLSSHIKVDFSDVRITDNKGQWIPHLVRNTWRENKSGSTIIHLSMASNERLSSNTVITIENSGKNLLNNFVLRLKNAAAERMTSLSGSEDNKNWFIIADSLLVTRADLFIKDENAKLISFPPTKYPFYKITIRNDKKDPLNVLEISSIIEPGHQEKARFIENPGPQFKQTDSAKFSLLKITHDKPYQFDQVKLEVRRPALYDRVARIYLEVKPGIMNTWESNPLTEIKISSSHPFNHALPLVRSGIFYIIISNQDNPPLEFSRISTLQTEKQVITYLEKGKSYQLLMDNPEASQPDYDLKAFEERIPEQIEILATSRVMVNNNPPVVSEKKASVWWIWATIAGVVLILGYLTWGLTKDMNKKEEVL